MTTEHPRRSAWSRHRLSTEQWSGRRFIVAAGSVVAALFVVSALGFALVAAPLNTSPSERSRVGAASSLLASDPTPLDTSSRSPSMTLRSDPSLDPSPHSSAVAAILNDTVLHLDLQPLPPGATWSVDETAALNATLAYFNLGPEDAVYSAHGIGYISDGQPEAAVWLIIARAADAPAYPVGPPCEDQTNTCQVWAKTDYVGALVSDQSGLVQRGFSTMKQAAPPSFTTERP